MLSAALFTLNAQTDEMKLEERDESADRLSGFVRNELKNGHTMLGTLKATRPRWVLEGQVAWRTEELGRFWGGVWNASDFTKSYADDRRMWLNEMDAYLGYGYAYGISEGWTLDSKIEWMWTELRYAHTPHTFYQWILTETLQTPWVDAYWFLWAYTHPYWGPAHCVGLKKDVPVWGDFSVEPNFFLDMGSSQWNRRRYGHWTTDEAHYRAGPTAANLAVTLNYRPSPNWRFYLAVQQYDLIADEPRRQKRAQHARNARRDYTFFIVGAMWIF